MEIQIGIIPLLLSFAVAQGIFLSGALLFYRRGNQKANQILALLIIVFSFHIGTSIVYWTQLLLRYPHLFAISAAVVFLYGPLFFLYAKFLLSSESKFRLKDTLHFLPFLAHLLYMVPLYALSKEIKLEIIKYNYSTGFQVDLMYLITGAIQIGHMLVYILLAVKLIQRTIAAPNGKASAIKKMHLHWLWKLILGFGLFFCLWLAYSILIFWGTPYLREMDYLMTAAEAVIIYTIGYHAFGQPEIFAGIPFKRAGRKYGKSTLTAEMAANTLEQLRLLMVTEKPFIDSELTLQTLAEKLSISPHHLSQMINEKLQQNFREFINHYRIEEAKQRLTDPENNHYTILSIGFDVGFNNKASFNTAFKKQTGMTPSQFRASAYKKMSDNK